MIDRNHPAVEAAAKSYARTSPARTDGFEDMHAGRQEQFLSRAHRALNAALPDLTADDLRNTPAGRALMAEAWSKFQEHYATEWETSYHERHFPSPEPAPAVVSRESVAAFMMRHWAKNLRSDPNPYEETPNE